MEPKIRELLDEKVVDVKTAEYAKDLLCGAQLILENAQSLGIGEDGDFSEIMNLRNSSEKVEGISGKINGSLCKMKAGFEIVEENAKELGLENDAVYAALLEDMHDIAESSDEEEDDSVDTLITKSIERKYFEKEENSSEEQLMKAVEMGLLLINDAAATLEYDVDDFYHTMLRTGHKVPFYMGMDDVLYVDYSIPYINVYNAFSLIQKAVLEMADKTGDAYWIELKGVDLYVTQRIPEEEDMCPVVYQESPFYIEQDYSPMDVVMKYYLCHSYNERINGFQEIFWDRFVEMMR